MTTKKTRLLASFIILMSPVLILLLSDTSWADVSIAKISSVKGEVIIQSGDTVSKLNQTGQVLNNGDQLLTRKGEVMVTFHDGAVLKLEPFSQTMIEQRDEESGTWIFKSKKPARRVTILVGKIWFRSGASNIRNHIQTPTAVCTLKGSDGDFGFDPVKLNTYLNMYSGEAAIVGNVIKGFFSNPGISAAQKSAIYQDLTKAYEKTEQAKASGKTLAIVQTKMEALNVAKEVALALQNNPDPIVRQEARIALAAVDASLALARASIAVAQIKNAEEAALKTAEQARKAGDMAKFRKYEQFAREAYQAMKRAEQDAALAFRADAAARKAANQSDLAAALAAAADAQRDSSRAQQAEQQFVQLLLAQGVVTTTVPATTVAPTTAPATTIAATTIASTTVAPTTAPMTTIETTTSTSTTTTTTTSTSTVKSPHR